MPPRPTMTVTKRAAPPPPKATPKPGLAPSRQGRRQINFWVEPEVARLLKREAAERDLTLEALLHQAIDTWCQVERLPPIAAKPRG